MMYEDETRGKILNPARKKQLFDFSRLRYGNCTGSDIDHYMELGDTFFIFIEFKYGRLDMPLGQKKAYTRLVDIVQSTGREAVLFLSCHFETDPDSVVDAAETIVEKYYYGGRWYLGEECTTKEKLDAFIQYASNKNNMKLAWAH